MIRPLLNPYLVIYDGLTDKTPHPDIVQSSPKYGVLAAKLIGSTFCFLLNGFSNFSAQISFMNLGGL